MADTNLNGSPYDNNCVLADNFFRRNKRWKHIKKCCLFDSVQAFQRLMRKAGSSFGLQVALDQI